MKRYAGFLRHLRIHRAHAEMLATDPYADFRLKAGTKRVVTFLRETPRTQLALPIAIEGARILCIDGEHVFSAYVPSPRGPAFMSLIEKTFGKDVTTRTWDTVRKVASQAGATAPRQADRSRRRPATRRARPSAPREHE